MKKVLLLVIVICLLFICSCTKQAQRDEQQELNENVIKADFIKEELDEKFGTDEIYIVKTYMETPIEKIKTYFDEGKIITSVKHYQLSDGTWKTDENSYKYMLKISGRLHNAAKDSTYIVLSNRDDITFDMAWKASGLSSNMDDYFKPEDAIIVGMG